MSDEKHSNIFLGIVIGIVLVVGAMWLFGGEERAPSEILRDCLWKCREEGELRPPEWLDKCEEACIKWAGEEFKEY